MGESEIDDKLRELGALEPDWEPGAPAIDPVCIEQARIALQALTHRPWIVPTVNGGVALGWAHDGESEYLTIVIEPGGLSASLGDLYAAPEE